jgi:hypothetical protein
VALEPQIARFRRGSDAVLVVGWEIPGDALAADSLVSAETRASAAIFASEGPDRPFVEARSAGPLVGTRDSGGAAAGALSLEVPWRRAVVGVEARVAGIAARWRGGMELPAEGAELPGVSDLLLLMSVDFLPATLAQAIPLARGSTVAGAGEHLGIFWEAYPTRGVPAGPVTISVSVRERESDPGALRWREAFPADTPAVPRAALLELPDLDPGRYAVEVEMTWPGTPPLRARREITIRD